jgi:hypothetical protein
MGKRGTQKIANALLHEVAERIPTLPPIIAAHILRDLVVYGPGRLARPNKAPVFYLGRYLGKLLRGEHVTHEQRTTAMEILRDLDVYKLLEEGEAQALLDDFVKDGSVLLIPDDLEEHLPPPQKSEAALDKEDEGDPATSRE